MKSKNKYLRFKNIAGDWRAFAVILGIFTVISATTAINADFPLPYDELYHFSIVQFYSDQLSPIVSSQPAELAFAGDITRMGSYLMHYLLSFPLRFIELFSQDVQAQVVVLRLINIGFVISALVLFQKFLFVLTRSKTFANLMIAAFCILPVSSQLAAHINYDNLMILAFAGLLVLTQSVVTKVSTGKRASIVSISALLSVALLGCLVKFSFLPVAAVVLAFTSVYILRNRAWPDVSIGGSSRLKIAVATLVLIVAGVSSGLVIERYGGNVLAYGSLQPDCDQVQPLNVCQQYGPWARNYALEQSAQQDKGFQGLSVEGYAAKVWAPIMVRGLGGVDKDGITPAIPKLVLVVLVAAFAVLGMGLLGAAMLRRKDPVVAMVVASIMLYSLALLQRNYSEFMSFHEAVAVQGRYLLPFIVPLFAIGLLGIKLYIDQVRTTPEKISALVSHLRTVNPDEAYEYSKNYWASRISERRLARN